MITAAFAQGSESRFVLQAWKSGVPVRYVAISNVINPTAADFYE
jgi:hypothetical protein